MFEEFRGRFPSAVNQTFTQFSHTGGLTTLRATSVACCRSRQQSPTSVRRGQHYITVMHDLDAKRLLFATEERDHRTVVGFAAGLKAHGGDPSAVRQVCKDMRAANAERAALAPPQAQISYNRFHVIAMANEAMNQVRRAEMRDEATAVRAALGDNDRKSLKMLMWGMRGNPSSWSQPQINSMHWLQHSTPKGARAWWLKIALQTVYGTARVDNNPKQASADLRGWLNWARRSSLDPFKKLAATIKDRFDAVVRRMADHRSNSYVEGMNGLLKQAKFVVRGFSTVANFIAIAYLRMSKLKHQPAHPFSPAGAK